MPSERDLDQRVKDSESHRDDSHPHPQENNGPALLNDGPELVRDLVSLIERAEADEGVRVLVFSSADPDYFIAHVDLTKVEEYRQEAAKLTGEASIALLFRHLSSSRLVSIAQVEGRVRGAGSEFVLACDMCFAARESAIFGQIEPALGVLPGGGAAQHLARRMGRGRALEVMLSAEDYDAELAERYGWINRALPADDLGEFVRSLAHRIAGFPAAGQAATTKTSPTITKHYNVATGAILANGKRTVPVTVTVTNPQNSVKSWWSKSNVENVANLSLTGGWQKPFRFQGFRCVPTFPNGIDGYFENVGGMILDAVMLRSNAFARIAHRDTERDTSPRQFIFGDGAGGVERIRIDLSGPHLDHVRAAMDTTPDALRDSTPGAVAAAATGPRRSAISTPRRSCGRPAAPRGPPSWASWRPWPWPTWFRQAATCA